MKKFYSIAVMTVIALCAACFAACSSDDEEVKTEPFTFTFTVTPDDVPTNAVNTVRDFFSSAVGKNYTVSSPSATAFTISGTDGMTDAYQKIEDADLTSLGNSLSDLYVKEVHVAITGGEAPLYYDFLINHARLILGTFTATIGGVNYKLVMSNQESEKKFTGTIYVGDEQYTGYTNYTGIVNPWSFHSDADDANGNAMFAFETTNDIYASFSEDTKTFTATVCYNGTTTENVVFTRQ